MESEARRNGTGEWVLARELDELPEIVCIARKPESPGCIINVT